MVLQTYDNSEPPEAGDERWLAIVESTPTPLGLAQGLISRRFYQIAPLDS